MPTHFPHNSERDGGENCTPITVRRNAVQKVAAVLGSAFLIVGIAGAMGAGGVRSGYDMSVTGSVVHVIFGGAGWLAAGSFRGARSYLIVGGSVYLVLSLASIVPGYAAVQVGVAVIMVVSGVWLGRRVVGDR